MTNEKLKKKGRKQSKWKKGRKQFKCGFCEKCFEDRSALAEHIWQRHWTEVGV